MTHAFPTKRISRVLRPAPVVLALLLCVHGGWRAQQGFAPPRIETLPPAPPTAWLSVMSLGEPVVLSRLLMLWLQSFDTAAGADLRYTDFDYTRLENWLRRCLALAPESQYPLLVASRLYAEVPDAARARRMLAFVAEAFPADPERRWPWLAHAVHLAQHRLHDPALAIGYARLLADSPAGTIPAWARQLEIFVREDAGEIAAARALLEALIASGTIRDPSDRRFLEARLRSLGDPRP